MEVNISFEDCVTIIKNCEHKALQVKSYEIIPVTTKLGCLGDYFKLKIRFIEQHEKEKQLFIKALPIAKSQRRFALENNAVIKEETFYSNFVSKCMKNGIGIIQECIARCYLIRHLTVFVFDDLSADNYQVLDARSDLTLQHIQLALKNFAKFHASSYLLEESLTKVNGKIYRIPNDFNMHFEEVLYSDTDVSKEYMKAIKTGIRAHVELFKADLDEVNVDIFSKNICNVLDEFPKYVQPSTKYRNVLCHGDLWTTNVMFKHENDIPVAFKMIDFQLYRYCPPTLDIVTFLYFCTSRMFRQEHFQNCINFYHDQLFTVLRAHHLDLDTIFPKRDFIESVNYYKTFAICQASTYGHISMIDRKLLSDILCDSDSVEEVMFKDRSVLMAKMLENDSIYKKKLYEMLKDLVEVIPGSNATV